MALNPDDLIIFKVRGEEESEKAKQKQKRNAQQEEPSQQEEKQEQQQPVLQKPRQQPVATPQAQQRQKPAPVPMQVKQQPAPVMVQQKKPQRQPEQHRQPSVERPKQPQAEEAEKAPQIAPVPESVERVAKEIEIGMSAVQPSPEIVPGAIPTTGTAAPRPQRKSLSGKESRRLAEHLTCELHPWRKAYAVCDYCKRAFCYEDIIEHGGKYYDLDDMDKIPQTEMASMTVSYNNLSLAASVLFMAIFLIFIYFTYSSLILYISLAGQEGIVAFFQSIDIPTALYITEIALAALAMASAVMVLLSTKKSYATGVGTALLTVLIFSYQYLVTQEVYYAAIASIAFVASVLLSYSRMAYEPSVVEETEAGEVLGAGSVLEAA